MSDNYADGKQNAKAVLVLGALQISSTLIILALDVTSLFLLSVSSSIFASAALSGIWCGIMQIVCGLMAVHGGKARGRGEAARCPLIASLVMSILSGLLTFGLSAYYCAVFAEASPTAVHYNHPTTTTTVQPNQILQGHYVLVYDSDYGGPQEDYYVFWMMLTFLAFNLAQCLICWGQVIATSIMVCRCTAGGTKVVYVSLAEVPAQPQYVNGQQVHMPQNLHPSPQYLNGQQVNVPQNPYPSPQYMNGQQVHMPQNLYPSPNPAGAYVQAPPAYAS